VACRKLLLAGRGRSRGPAARLHAGSVRPADLHDRRARGVGLRLDDPAVAEPQCLARCGADRRIVRIGCLLHRRRQWIPRSDVGFVPEGALLERWNGTHWTIEPTGNPAGTWSGTSFSAVSCVSPTVCMAVGEFVHASGSASNVAERKSGSRSSVWVLPPTAGLLSSVSCPSTTACVAVASVPLCDICFPSGGPKPLAERWNGTRWSGMLIPDPDSSFIGLNGLSCPLPTFCLAVGSHFHVPMSDRFNGGRWVFRQPPIPSTGYGALNGISCTSPSLCTAVGSQGVEGGDVQTLVARWNAGRWFSQQAPNPESTDVELRSVSCPGPTACTAVGDFRRAGHERPFAEHWNGSAWTIQATQAPPGDVTLRSVSCGSPTACTAVGGYTNARGVLMTLVEHWSGQPQ